MFDKETTVGDLGFWALAQEDPDHLALVTPEGRDVTAGELLGRANQLVQALRGIGFETGDVVATLLPNGAEMIEIYLAALQAGWYLVPINHHLVAPEVAYILKDSGQRSSCRTSASPTPLSRQRTKRGSRPTAGSQSARSRSSPPTRTSRRVPDDDARGPDDRRRHELHVGDDGQPEGDPPQALPG